MKFRIARLPGEPRSSRSSLSPRSAAFADVEVALSAGHLSTIATLCQPRYVAEKVRPAAAEDSRGLVRRRAKRPETELIPVPRSWWSIRGSRGGRRIR